MARPKKTDEGKFTQPGDELLPEEIPVSKDDAEKIEEADETGSYQEPVEGFAKEHVTSAAGHNVEAEGGVLSTEDSAVEEHNKKAAKYAAEQRKAAKVSTGNSTLQAARKAAFDKTKPLTEFKGREGAPQSFKGQNVSSLYKEKFNGLAGYDLTGRDFSGADCRGVNFQGAILKDANFSGADLTGADLRWAFVGGMIVDGDTDFTSVQGLDQAEGLDEIVER